MKDTYTVAQLIDFGLSANEAQIYRHLLGRAPKTVVDIANDLNVPRTTVYDSAQKLAEKGLISSVAQYKSRKLKAYPVTILQGYIDAERARVESLQAKLTQLEVSLSVEDTQTSGEVRYYHGVKGIEQMVWNTLRTKGELIGYSQFGLSQILTKRFIDRYNHELDQRKIPNRFITNAENVAAWHKDTQPIETYRNTLQECRLLPKEQIAVTGDTTIYNQTFAVMYWTDGEIGGVEIDHPDIVKIQRSIFAMLWTQAKPVS
jgi:sugar-specific transcriptional regulator TrmB